jgi:hypothetical protein
MEISQEYENQYQQERVAFNERILQDHPATQDPVSFT